MSHSIVTEDASPQELPMVQQGTLIKGDIFVSHVCYHFPIQTNSDKMKLQFLYPLAQNKKYTNSTFPLLY